MTDASLLEDPGTGVALPEPREPAGLTTREADALLKRELRRQIATMERDLGRLFASAFPRAGIEWGVGRPMHGPRILSVAELEALRDELAGHLAHVRGELGSRLYREEQRRRLLEAMLADPAGHRWLLVSNEDIGEPGCKHWHSRPRLGPIGMLMGWWRVKVSSGCPLAGGRGPRETPRNG